MLLKVWCTKIILNVNLQHNMKVLRKHTNKNVRYVHVNEGVKRMLPDSLEIRNWRTKFLNEKWLNMNMEIVCRKILKCINKVQISYLGRYLDKVEYK